MSSRQGWFTRLLVYLDRPLRVAGKLTFVTILLSIFGGIIASFVQYAAWRDEKNLARHTEELSQATATLSDLSTTLSAIMNLQQLLVFTFVDAFDPEVEANPHAFMAHNATKLYDDYFVSRTALRKNIDSLSWRVSAYVDVPFSAEGSPTSPKSLLSDKVHPQPYRDPPKARVPFTVSNRNMLSDNGFDCRKNLPSKEPSFVTIGEIIINWHSAKHHVVTFFFCLEKLHYDIFAVREWVATGKVTDSEKNDLKRNIQSIRDDLDLQTSRFNALMALMTSKVHAIRLRERPQNFFCHELGFCQNQSAGDVVASVASKP